MTRQSNKRWLVAVLVAVSWASCGGAGTEGVLDPTGGEVCLPDRRVCISVPLNAVTETRTVRISPSNEAPPAALSEAWDIAPSNRGADGGSTLEFLKPALVSFSLAIVDAGDVPNETLLRIYTIEDGAWVALANPRIDRVRDAVLGEVSHLSPFVVLRADRLPDGGLPIEVDGGHRDSGVVIVVPFDAGVTHFDAGQPDAGHPHADAGQPDAGHPHADAGQPDAGHDAGQPDAGYDAGQPDAGHDAGEPDAGPAPVDAGPQPVDAGPEVPDAGDAGQTDDAGQPDAGDGG